MKIYSLIKLRNRKANVFTVIARILVSKGSVLVKRQAFIAQVVAPVGPGVSLVRIR